MRANLLWFARLCTALMAGFVVAFSLFGWWGKTTLGIYAEASSGIEQAEVLDGIAYDAVMTTPMAAPAMYSTAAPETYVMLESVQNTINQFEQDGRLEDASVAIGYRSGRALFNILDVTMRSGIKEPVMLNDMLTGTLLEGNGDLLLQAESDYRINALLLAAILQEELLLIDNMYVTDGFFFQKGMQFSDLYSAVDFYAGTLTSWYLAEDAPYYRGVTLSGLLMGAPESYEVNILLHIMGKQTNRQGTALFADYLPFNPLTGENYDINGNPWNEAISQQRPWAVSIGNMADAQPLWGISDADIIFEFVVETTATRILAMYQDISKVGRIGGIRSLRQSSMEMMMGFDAIFTHWGGRTYDNVEVKGNPITIHGTVDAMALGSRDSEKSGWNNAVVTGGTVLTDGIPSSLRTGKDSAYDGMLKFSEVGTPMDGLPTGSVSVRFSSKTSKQTTFEYDIYEAKYYASQFNRPFVDGNNNRQLSFKNLLILRTDLDFNVNASKHTSMRMTGEGEGYFVCGGKYIDIKWTRDSLDSPFRFWNMDGSELELGVGKSYIAIVSTDAAVRFS